MALKQRAARATNSPDNPPTTPKVTTPAPGERQPGEPDSAWSAFVMYRDLGPEKRSTAEVARRLSKTKTITDRWSGRWGWVERAHAWDNEVDRVKREEELEAVRKMAADHARTARGLILVLSEPARELADRIKRGVIDFKTLKDAELVALLSKAAPAIARLMEAERLARGADVPLPPPAPIIVRVEDESLARLRSAIAAVAPRLTIEEQLRLIEESTREAGIDVPGQIIEAEGHVRE